MATLQQISCQRIHLHDIENRIEAAMRADAMLVGGALAGYAVWKRVLRAVGDLRGTAPGARVH